MSSFEPFFCISTTPRLNRSDDKGTLVRVGLLLLALVLSMARVTHATGGMITRDNNVVGWPRQSTIQVSVEAGGLSGLDNAAIRGVVQRAADVWNRESTGPGRPTDAPRLEMLPDAAPPIEDSGFRSFLDSIRESVAPQRPFVLHLVLEDTADGILGAEGGGYIGATTPIYSGIAPAAMITVIRAMRGARDTDMEWDEPSLEEVVVHELGHTLLLAHTENPHDRRSRDIRVPAMYPVPRRNTLAADDRASLAFAYPRQDGPSRYRRVTGVVTTLAGQPVVNANVIFETRDGPPSSYSAFTYRGDAGNTAGRYDLYVLPGRYRRHVQNREFTRDGDTSPRIESPEEVIVPNDNELLELPPLVLP